MKENIYHYIIILLIPVGIIYVQCKPSVVLRTKLVDNFVSCTKGEMKVKRQQVTSRRVVTKATQ